MVTRTAARLDDDEVFDAELHDPKFYPKLVFRDGKGPRVKLMLTDAAPPEWMRTPRRAQFNQPRFAVVAAADPHVVAAEQAYADRNANLRDAWKTMGGGTGGAAHTTAAGADQPDDPDEDPRAAYIRRTSNAWRTPIGGPGAAANSIEAQRQDWLKPGARPGTTKDAAISDRAAADEAYRSYVDRIANAWRAR